MLHKTMHFDFMTGIVWQQNKKNPSGNFSKVGLEHKPFTALASQV